MIEDTLKLFSYFKRTYTLPFQYNIPTYTEQYLNSHSFFKRFFKFFRRYLYIFFKNHIKLEQNYIQENQKNILWINLSAPSLGDSLMDLSSRILLEDKKVDLYTDKKNAHIYFSDGVFENIFTNYQDLQEAKYDLIIIDSYGTKSLKTKFSYFSKIPYVGMYGYYNGPEVNRVLYSFHRMNQLLGYKKSEFEINNIAKSMIYISKDDEKLITTVSLPQNYISIAIGGEWEYRTYKFWNKIIKYILEKYPEENIVLIGSTNALQEATTLSQKFGKKIYNKVAKYSFNQTAQIIKNSNLLLCCDGGLMHAANSVQTPIIPLFARLTPAMQLTATIKAYPLFDEINVNNIKPEQIIKKFEDYKRENHEY